MTFGQRDTIVLNDNWLFTVNKNAENVTQKWNADLLSSSLKVNIPHTWNIDEKYQNHYGWAWYQKSFSAPQNWKNKTVNLQFDAINHTASIYLNGKKIAEHIGDGFNQFSIDLTEYVALGEQNILTVAVNNEYSNHKVPFGSSFDWPNDGGIIRPVRLIVSGNPSVRHIHATPKLNLQNNTGILDLKLAMQHTSGIQFQVQITEENQSTKQLVYSKIVTPTWSNHSANTQIVLPNVHPWHFDFPNLYRISVVVLKNSKPVDQISTNIGFRELKFVDGMTYLNGERIKLMGVEWTAGSNPNFGFAESDSLIRAMGKLMKDVNCIFSRQHFQQSATFYDFCDRNGILVQQEIPLWGPETPGNDTILNLATNQLVSMIENLYNHPSIFSWGVGNELRSTDKDIQQLINQLMEKARLLDSTRYVAYVSNSLTYSFYNNPHFKPDAAVNGDYLMMNEYGGSWWTLPSGSIGAYLDSVHQTYPKLPFFISEFGLCEPNFKGGDQRRIEDLIYHMGVYESKTYVEGAIYFDLTDYRTHYPGTSENNKFRRRVHGVYDMYGAPKPSMAVLREQSSPIEIHSVRHWSPGKLNILIFGSTGLPQHLVKGYKLYISDRKDNYKDFPSYEIPELKPGEQIGFEVPELIPGNAIITVVRPTGYVVTQKTFNWSVEDQ